MKWVIVLCVLLAACQPTDILEVNLREHKNLYLHIHPTLEIEINGESVPIPSNVGISSAGMRVIHTHEADGKLHVESPSPHQFVLSDFFTIWNKRMTSECIFEYCADDAHELVVLVNGRESPLMDQTPLHDLDRIQIVYREKNTSGN